MKTKGAHILNQGEKGREVFVERALLEVNFVGVGVETLDISA